MFNDNKERDLVLVRKKSWKLLEIYIGILKPDQRTTRKVSYILDAHWYGVSLQKIMFLMLILHVTTERRTTKSIESMLFDKRILHYKNQAYTSNSSWENHVPPYGSDQVDISKERVVYYYKC